MSDGTIRGNDPAFPMPACKGNNYLTGETDVVIDPERGMSLRAYFAGQALLFAGQLYKNDRDFDEGRPSVDLDVESSDLVIIASYAVNLADAVLDRLGQD